MGTSPGRSSAELKAMLDLQAKEFALLDAESKQLTGIFNINQRNFNMQQQAYALAQQENIAREHFLALVREGADEADDRYVTAKATYEQSKLENKEADIKLAKQKKSNELAKHYYETVTKTFSLQAGWIKALNESDKIIRQTILNLGLSGKKAEAMRSSFEDSAIAVNRMGGSLVDIQQVMQGYAEETGRARVLTSKMVTDIIEIGRGTGLGVEAATKLGAQFELMGFDAANTNKTIQGFVDSTERMGINTTKVFKAVNDNFKRLQTYSFQGGVKGMLAMSQYAAKMNIDMNQALNAADVAKSLEGAIGLAAQLQVMGGEFAKADPFQLLFLSRNDPAKFTEKINDMTKGIVSFRKMADGTFEKFISPADRDRMAAVEKSLGMQTGELTQQALRMVDIQKMRQNMLTSSLSAKDKETISSAAIYNKETGQFQVQIAGVAKNIASLNEEEAKTFLSQKVTLEQRAKDALTFEDALAATLASLKSVLLPMLRGFQVVIDKVMPMFNWFVDLISGNKGFFKVAGIITGAAVLLVSAAKFIQGAAFLLMGKEIFGKGLAGRATGALQPGGLGGELGDGGISKNRGRGALLRGQGQQAAGKGSMMRGAGVGAAAVGIGAGIGIAAAGFSKLAEAMQKLDATQIAALPGTIWAMTGAISAFIIPLALVAGVAKVAWPELLALGAAGLMIGAGIGIAAAGIGFMASGLGELSKNIKGTGNDFIKLGVGIAAIALSLGTMSNPFTLAGIGAFGLVMAGIVGTSMSVAKVANSMANMGVALKGSAADFIAIQNAVESISKANIGKGGMLGELAQLLKSPLKVEFADKKFSFVSDITMNIDGQKFMQKVYNGNTAASIWGDMKAGKAAPPHK